ncbi:alpha/beta fold hydrolase [soil metagenome]
MITRSIIQIKSAVAVGTIFCLLITGCGGGGSGGSSSGGTTADTFYDVSSVQSGQAPGTLVKKAQYPGSGLAGVNSRIMYISVDGNGVAVPATAVVTIPSGTPPAGGWPVISWAHGTVGVGKNCAPSMTTNLTYDFYMNFINAFVARGYAVVATDYSGLGTTGRHFYLNKESNARDVIEAVVAATNAYPALSKSFAVVGHSQGALAAVGVAELINSLNIAPLQYKGAVALGPSLGFTASIQKHIVQTGVPNAEGVAYQLLGAYSIKLSDPSINYSQILSPAAAAFMPAVTQACFPELIAQVSSLPYPNPAVVPSWPDDPQFTSYTQKNLPGQVKPAGPLFIALGSADTVTPKVFGDYLVSSYCPKGSVVKYKIYDGAGHNEVLAFAANDVFAWLGQQFSGTYVAPAVCGT